MDTKKREALNLLHYCCVAGKLNDCVGVMPGHAVMDEQEVQEGTEHAPLRDPLADQRGRCFVPYPYHLGAAPQEVQDTVAEGDV